MSKATLLVGLSALVLAALPGGAAGRQAGAKPAAATYASAATVFKTSCVGCHGAGRPQAGIDLRTYASVMKGGRKGKVVKAGDPANSPLVWALRGTHKAMLMPPGSPLPDAKIKVVEAWIKAGAKNK